MLSKLLNIIYHTYHNKKNLFPDHTPVFWEIINVNMMEVIIVMLTETLIPQSSSALCWLGNKQMLIFACNNVNFWLLLVATQIFSDSF